jgi:tetratricopeptide (TPR) repeat protein
VGSLRADENVDVIPGLPRVLSEDREPITVAMVERRLLARSLVDMASIEAAPVLGDIIATDAEAWRWEWRRMVWRLGHRGLPMLLMLDDHRDEGARRWARWGLREIGLADPGRAIQTEDMRLLAEIIRAYGTRLDMDAMRVVVGFVTHDRAQVRNAARWATERYGRNAIWQLRRVYRNLTGAHADRSLGWEATAALLYAAHDQERLAPVRAELDRGHAALAAGDLDTMREKYDAVLVATPDLPRRAELAPGYAALAARALGRGDITEAERFYRRALRLSPTHPEAASFRAQLRFLDAERRLASGIADLGAYQAVLVEDPVHEGALSFVMAAREGEEQDGSPFRRIALAIAALLFLGGAGTMWLRRNDGVDTEDIDTGDAMDHAIEDAIDPDPDTLPG